MSVTKKIVEFRVLFSVDDGGELDEGTMRDAIARGIDIEMQEGGMTLLDDTTTMIDGFTVSHTGTRN